MANAGAVPARASTPAATTAVSAFSNGYRIGQVCVIKRDPGNARRRGRNSRKAGENAGSIPGGVSPLMHREIVPSPIWGTIRENVSTSRGTFSSGHAFQGYFLSHEVRSAPRRISEESTRKLPDVPQGASSRAGPVAGTPFRRTPKHTPAGGVN